jgi:hypothetical protein
LHDAARIDWDAVHEAARRRDGVPVPILKDLRPAEAD